MIASDTRLSKALAIDGLVLHLLDTMISKLFRAKWVCLKMGYTPNYSHLIGIMISKTIGFRGTQHFQTHPNSKMKELLVTWGYLARLLM